MGHINVEIKAKCQDQERIRRILLAEGAEFRGLDHQIDTYFLVQNGRLKLREGNIENTLIFYERDDQEGPKQSNVHLYHLQPGASLKEVLIHALGIKVIVDKQREIYFVGNVKFHIDVVAGLGQFVEIEAIDKDGTIGREKLLGQCQRYMSLFNICPEDLITCSYSDLLLRK